MEHDPPCLSQAGGLCAARAAVPVRGLECGGDSRGDYADGEGDVRRNYDD